MDREQERRRKSEEALAYLRAHHGKGRAESWDEFLHRVAEEIAAGRLTTEADVSELDLAVMYCVGRRISERIIREGRLPEQEYAMPMSVMEMVGSIREWCGRGVFNRMVEEHVSDDLVRAMNENVRPKVHDKDGRLCAAGIVWDEPEG